MWPYWLLFLFFAAGALLTFRPAPSPVASRMEGGAALQEEGAGRETTAADAPLGFLFSAGMVFVTLIIGLRHEVGGDWPHYLHHLELARLISFEQHLWLLEPGYSSLNWIVARAGGDIWLVNLFCGTLFCWGLARFARTQPEPWLVVVLAVPYLVIVVAMGYTRQAVALGILMAGMAAVFRGGSLLRLTVYVAVAALFHRTAIVFLPLLTFAFPRSRATNIILTVGIAAALYFVFLDDATDRLVQGYLVARYDAAGATVRAAQLILAAIIFFLARKSLRFPHREEQTWKAVAIASFMTIPALFVAGGSAAVDRIALYLIPIQLAILSRLPMVTTGPVLARMGVTAYAALVLFVWLNYAHHAEFWLPYKTIFADDGSF